MVVIQPKPGEVNHANKCPGKRKMNPRNQGWDGIVGQIERKKKANNGERLFHLLFQTSVKLTIRRG